LRAREYTYLPLYPARRAVIIPRAREYSAGPRYRIFNLQTIQLASVTVSNNVGGRRYYTAASALIVVVVVVVVVDSSRRRRRLRYTRNAL